ncbi:YheC/YheD family endospore coat-associated protein [Alteribacter natronophilus]|uniref:YheC/YheD family endospore coat-associated protein n=1 Tax=Alteribacter natronophilus TaxID=2583810 RepID=UPI00110F104F|nr:YheC/YheD family protein [Alteribacter natronophilus]TMW74030.1 YheC/YheD family protein [Alteribacter natronophilus]
MSTIIKTWKVTPHPKRSVFLPSSFMNGEQIEEGSLYTLQFGTKETEVRVRQSALNEFEISTDVKDQLYLPVNGPLSFHAVPDSRILAAGPHIGIYTAGFTQSLLRPAGDRSFLFSKYLLAAKKAGISCFLFGAPHIHWEDGLVEGLVYDREGWKKVLLPLPDVVYDRIPNRRTEAHAGYAEVRERLQTEYQIPWFNPGFFDKWHIHQALSDTPASRYLPDSILGPDMTSIREFLHEHRHIYVKPAKGSLGAGIHQILYDQDQKMYYCRFRDQEKNRLRRYSSFQRLLKKQFPAGLKQMVVQQGIDLLTSEQKPVDFRIHTNKDENGEWQLSAFAAKMAGLGSVTTHVKSGGKIKSLQELKSDTVISDRQYEKLRAAALEISETIDREIEGNIGEIGFDFGIDIQDRIWMFEANSKPGRSIFSHPFLKKDDHLTRHLPFAYGTYLFKQMLLRDTPVYYR